MGDEGGYSFPANMTEENIIEIIRELLGEDDMTDAEMIAAYRSGMFQELCPDIAQYAKQKQKKTAKRIKVEASASRPINVEPSASRPIKVETSTSKPIKVETSTSKPIKVEPSASRPIKVEPSASRPIKVEASTSRPIKLEAEASKPLEKVSRPVKTSSISAENKIPTVNLSGTDSDQESRHSHHHKKKKKKKHKHHKDDKHHADKDDKHHRNKDDKHQHKDKDKDDKERKREKENSVKIKVESAEQPILKDVKREETGEKKREPKPSSKYSTGASHIKIRRWKPVLDKDHTRHQMSFGLKPMSIVCLDLLDLPIVFHHPHKGRKNPNSVPLTSNLPLAETQVEMIRRLERDKLSWFKGTLTRQALKSTKNNGKRGRFSSSDEEMDRKPKHRIRRVSGSSNSSNLMVPVPYKKAKMNSDNRKDRGGMKLSKSDREADLKRRKMEEIKMKAEKLSARGTRILSWENKDTYFNKKKRDEAIKEKQKAQQEKEKKKKLELQKAKLLKQKAGPSVSFQRILAQIDAANKEEAKKPTVELKIPKLSQKSRVLNDEYKIERKISVGDVAKEVTRLLNSNVKVEMPVMPDSSEDLGEYTVKKIAWWVLKSEKDPPDQGVFHPELHDNDDLESIHSDDFDWPSDMSSINGCVSDPEGLASEMPPDPTKVNDPDWADDYCGDASLYAKMRREHDSVDDLESFNAFKSFLRTKPGTNYSKSNFEVKCFLCNELIKGQRQLGAHIRSKSHKNNFRNYSLNMVNCDEKIERGVPIKEFAAKLVEYSVNENGSTSEKLTDFSEIKKHQVGKIERVRSDSPGPIIGGDAAGNIQVHAMPIPDDLSFASIEDYDISSDESLKNVRVVIRTDGRWNNDLEQRWRTWQDEEAKIAVTYNEEREWYINEPQRHPSYQEEWHKFWEKRCDELEAEGKDTENYDFQKDWLPFWLKRMQEILKAAVEKKVHELKCRYKIDKHTLRKMYQISAEATKRKKLKKKVGKIEQENSSSLKSSGKVESNVKSPPHQKMAPLSQQHQSRHRHSDYPRHSPSHYQRSNNVHKNRGPDERRQDSYGGNRGQYHRSRNPKHNIKITDESNVRERHELDNISPVSSNIGDSSNDKSQRNNSLKSIKSICSNVSSAELRPPGDETFLGLNKSRPPQNPILSKTQINEMKEQTSRNLNEPEHNARSHNSSKLDKHLARNDGRGEKDNSNCRKSKHGDNPWLDDRNDDSNKKRKKRRDSDNDSSASGNARAAKSSLQALREALANEESMNSSGRPKIRPVEKPEKRLEDGEVASDVSSLDDFNPGLQGVSTFINKSIPGLTPETTNPEISSENLSKNSLGYHLLERRKSADQQQTNSHSGRYVNGGRVSEWRTYL